jgi:SAM-dependent methyltransferase
MTAFAQALKERYFRGAHPYEIFEREVERHLLSHHTLLDAGCGRWAPTLTKFKGRAQRLIGVDLVQFASHDAELELLNNDLADMRLDSASVDLVMSRSVMEHVSEPARVYQEIHRVLKPGGHFIFLTANLWDYASLIAALVPNRFHPWIVSKTEGRDECDVFPVAYRSNTWHAVRKWTGRTGFDIVSFEYLGQYPSYFMFNGLLFLVATGYHKIISRVSALNFLQGWLLVTLRKGQSAVG